MRETLRDFMIGIGAAAALFAAFQSWSNGGEIARNREAIAELRGTLDTTAAVVTAHVNAAGLHGER